VAVHEVLKEQRALADSGTPRSPAWGSMVIRRLDWTAVAFICPIAVLVLLMVFIPIGRTIYYALCNYQGLGSPQFTGLANFRNLAADPTFRRVILNNLLLVFGLFLWVTVPFILAVILYRRSRADVIRTILFVPVLLPPVVVGTAFRIILADNGPVNGVLGAIGLGHIEPGWLTDQHLVLLSVALVITWAVMGSGVLFYSAGLAAMPYELTEAALIDGAEWRHLVWHVYRPGLRHVTRFFALLLTVSTVTGFFPWIFGLTQGGPGVSSTTLDFDVYESGILGGNYGAASAIAVCSIIFLCMVLGCFIVLPRLSRRWHAPHGLIERVDWRRTSPSGIRIFPIPARRFLASRMRDLIVGLAILAVAFPLVWVIRLAFKPEQQWIGNPDSFGGGWTMANFTGAWSSGNLGTALLNSLMIVPLGALIATTVSTLAGYALVKLRVPGKRAVLICVALAVFTPLPAIAIPLFNQALSFGYADQRLGLSLVYGSIFAAWGTLLMATHFRELPDELIEAARVDGASSLRTFLRVALPLAMPGLAALFVINLLIQWNELIIALVMLPDPTKQTVTVAIATFTTQFRTGGPLTAAGVLIAACPIIVIYGVSQRFIRADVLAGAVKG
jgi:ABC-type sugar transport system permease subunit